MAGGLVGEAHGRVNPVTITNSTASVDVLCRQYAGGLAGYVYNASITDSDAAGTVRGRQTGTMGGLVGGTGSSAVQSSNAYVTLVRLCGNGSADLACDGYSSSTDPLTPELIGRRVATTVTDSFLNP